MLGGPPKLRDRQPGPLQLPRLACPMGSSWKPHHPLPRSSFLRHGGAVRNHDLCTRRLVNRKQLPAVPPGKGYASACHGHETELVSLRQQPEQGEFPYDPVATTGQEETRQEAPDIALVVYGCSPTILAATADRKATRTVNETPGASALPIYNVEHDIDGQSCRTCGAVGAENTCFSCALHTKLQRHPDPRCRLATLWSSRTTPHPQCCGN
ncbi:hypothetical protein HPB48_001408 [Haemaphysalis longicornis]|uniref:Uncharacterized protein n=1 Tax=Haemaphysalis longicornis TaxID=44386 RepID=A0A9J6GTW1_HAELO|nr:hypothetical protein HPB48_001408 [Haemaphysalis longicornis]